MFKSFVTKYCHFFVIAENQVNHMYIYYFLQITIFAFVIKKLFV